MADYFRPFVVSPFIAIFGSEGTLFLQLAPGRYETFQFMMGCKDNGGVADGGKNAAQSRHLSTILRLLTYSPRTFISPLPSQRLLCLLKLFQLRL
jgi:hypothetical protein